MPKGTDTGNHPARRVGRDRYAEGQRASLEGQARSGHVGAQEALYDKSVARSASGITPSWRPPSVTHMNIRGGGFYPGKESNTLRPAITITNEQVEGDTLPYTRVRTSGPAGPLVTQRGPSWSQPKTTRFSGAD